MLDKIISLFIITALAAGVQGQHYVNFTEFANGLDRPTDISKANDGRLYVTERDGKVQIVETDGSLGGVFVDISSSIPSTSGERGLLGLAFHPLYPDSSYVYLSYTGAGGDSKISRFDVLSPTEADPNSELNLLTVSQPFSNHNGGDLVFDHQGYLYISLGDGGSGGDPLNNGQDLTTLLGKILRIDVDGGNPYAIPPDNPFVGDTTGRDEIWAYGFRNPWRICFDSLTGGLIIGDVGQNAWEEVDFIPETGFQDPNYGWRCYEGNHTYDLSECGDVDTLVFPVYEYPHTGDGCSGSISGGVVYRGRDIPFLYGKYVYADYCTGQIGTLDVDGNYEQDSLQDFTNFQIVSFGTDVQGRIYFAATNEGAIYRFEPKDTNHIFSFDLDSVQMGDPGGTGYGIASYNVGNGKLTLSGNFSGLSSASTSAALYAGEPGAGGDSLDQILINPPSDTAGSIYGEFTLSPFQASLLVGNNLFVLIKSVMHPDGAISGSIDLRICPDLFDATAPDVPTAVYNAIEIKSAGLIDVPGSVRFQFEQSASLEAGFQTEVGAVLEILQKNCSGN